MKVKYPSWRYHPDGRSMIVADPGEESRLGPEWTDSPAKFSEPETQVSELPELMDVAPLLDEPIPDLPKRRRGRPRKVRHDSTKSD